jgi:hypothetical protein
MARHSVWTPSLGRDRVLCVSRAVTGRSEQRIGEVSALGTLPGDSGVVYRVEPHCG